MDFLLQGTNNVWFLSSRALFNILARHSDILWWCDFGHLYLSVGCCTSAKVFMVVWSMILPMQLLKQLIATHVMPSLCLSKVSPLWAIRHSLAHWPLFARLLAYEILIFLHCPVFTLSCFQAEDDDVCDGALAEQGPIVAHDLRKISPFDRSSTLLCNSIFGLCQQPAVQQLKFPLSSVPKNQKQWTSQGRQPFQVVHFSDVHIDREYTVCILAELDSLYSWSLKHIARCRSELHETYLLQELYSWTTDWAASRDTCKP